MPKLENTITINVQYKFPKNFIPDSLPGKWPRKNWWKDKDIVWSEILDKEKAYMTSITYDDGKPIYKRLLDRIIG